MPRFFVCREAIDTENRTVKIEGDDARHIARSLRMAVGDGLTVCDGSSTEYECRLERIRDEECELSIISSALSAREPKFDITLCMAYPKADKLETVIQKAVELGATRIIPFESKRCIKRPKAEKLDKLNLRHARIAEEASKQCGRAKIPEVSSPMSFSEMLKEAAKSELSLLCYEGEDTLSIKDALPDAPPASISVIIGAEGGFDYDEAAAAEAAGARSVTLGKRILRCETAPSFALTAISFKYEL